MRLLPAILCFLSFSLLGQPFNPNRYKKNIFPYADTAVDVLYGSAPVWTFPYADENLYVDIYQPQGDTHYNRPLIIFAHAGGFLNGDKQVDNMVALCDSFAKMGFVAASIGYRKGFNPLDSESAERAVYRGVQDGKACVRFFKHNAATYNIDTNYIFFGGMSAGGFMSLYVGYMDKESERPQSTYGWIAPDLGCLDCSGNNFATTSKVRAIIDMWGAVSDTTIIEPGDIPALIMHGINDGTVPYYTGYAFGLITLPETHGAGPISERMTNIGVPHELITSYSNLHMLDGSDNGTFVNPPNSFWYDTLFPRSTAFLYEIMKPKTYKISPDTSYIGQFQSLTLEVSDTVNSIYYDWMIPQDVIVLNDQDISMIDLRFDVPGTYDIRVVEVNDLLCIGDTLTLTVVVSPSPAGIEDIGTDKVYIYPNPVKEILYFSEEIESGRIINALGQKMMSFENKKHIDISSLQKGIYFVEMKYRGQRIVHRFVKE